MTLLPPSTINSLLTGINCQGNIHLIIGTNPLASTRCTQSLRAGALPILLAASELSELHNGLRQKIEEGSVKWERKAFEDTDLFRLGREEVGSVVDAVFVTSGSRGDQSRQLTPPPPFPLLANDPGHTCSSELMYIDG